MLDKFDFVTHCYVHCHLGEAPRQSSQNNAASSNVGQVAANNDQVQYPQTQSQNTQVRTLESFVKLMIIKLF